MDSNSRFDEGVALKELQKALLKYGYHHSISYDINTLKVAGKDVEFTPSSLFFVDAGFRMVHTYLFAISSPKYEVRGSKRDRYT